MWDKMTINLPIDHKVTTFWEQFLRLVKKGIVENQRNVDAI